MMQLHRLHTAKPAQLEMATYFWNWNRP